tara:strand:+ start:86 stop:1000 length:915 start_codon:yes stop_codon:yes gene_type:complete
MRLAIIISGMLRNFDHTIFATERFILNDDFFKEKDIFFCGYSDHLELNEAITKFNKLYKPKKFQIEEWNDEIKTAIELKTSSDKWPGFQPSCSITNVMSAWRCRYLANQFKIEYENANNFKYDLVYQLRTDFFCFDNIDHSLALKASKDKRSVYVPKDWDCKLVRKVAVGDIMAYGSSNAMNKYFSFYLYAKSYWQEKVIGHPETMLGTHFKKQKIKRKYCPRNVAREYPLTSPESNYLWSKWPREDILMKLGNDSNYLLTPSYKINDSNQNRMFYKYINKIKSIKIISKVYLYLKRKILGLFN